MIDNNENIGVNENVNTINENTSDNIITNQTNNINNGQTTTGGMKTFKFKSKIWLILAGVLLIIAGIITCYFTIYTNPKMIYKKAINEITDTIFDVSDNLEDKESLTLKLDADLKLENGMDLSEISKLINDVDLTLNVQIDKTNKEAVLKLNSNYEKEKLLNVELYTNTKDKKAYLYVKDYLDKYLEFDVEDYTAFFESIEDKEVDPKAHKTAKKIFKNELYALLQKEYLGKESKGLTNTYTYKIEYAKLLTILNQARNNLKVNEEFLNCFEDRNVIIEMLDNLDFELEGAEGNVEIKITTSGLIQKVTGASLKYELDGESIELKTSVGEDTINIDFISNGETEITINCKDENDNIVTEIKVIGLGSLKLITSADSEILSSIDKINTSKVVKIEELTEEDLNKVVTKLQDSKLYEFIEMFTGINLNGAELNTDVIFSSDDEIELESSETTNNANINTSANAIIIKDYDGKTQISVQIPSGYEEVYKNDNYASYSKDDIDVTMEMVDFYKSEEECLEEADESYDFLKKEEDYKNVTMSEKREMAVGSKTFSYKVLTYDLVSSGVTSKYTDYYICTKVSNDVYYVVEISAVDEEITQDLINQFLNIK